MIFTNWREAPLELVELAESFDWQMSKHTPDQGELYLSFEQDRLFLTRDGKTKIFVDFAEGESGLRFQEAGRQMLR